MARQYYEQTNAGPVNNTSNSTWEPVVTLDEFTPDVSSSYAFFWTTGLQNASNASADAKIQVRFGPVGFETTITTLNIESAATTEYPQLAGMFFHDEDVAPIDVYADVSIQPETNGNSINGKNGQIVALKLGANDTKAQSLTRQTRASSTPADAVSVSFTSDGGDYVVVGSGDFDCNITTVPVYIRLQCDGTNTDELGVRTNDTSNLSPGMMVWRFASVASGPRSASFQYRSHNGTTTAGITNARILVMRAADFDAVYGDQLTTDSAGTESSATAITFTETLSANPHLLIGGWGTSSTTSTTLVTTDVTEAGSDIAESIRRAYNAAQIRFHNSAFASVRTPGAGSTTYTLDRSQSGSATIAVGAGSGLVLLDLGSAGGGTDQDLFPSLLTKTKTIYAPVVSVGAVSLVPPLLTRTKTLYGLTITRGAVTLSPSLVSRPKTIYAPTVSQPQVLSPSLVTRSKTLYAPTVTVGSVTLAPSLVTRSKSLFAPTVAATYSLAAPLLTRSKTAYAPVVTTTNAVLPGLLTRTKTIYGPAVTVGSVTLLPGLLTRGKTIYAPSVSQGVVTIAPPLVSRSKSVFAPVVTRGAVSLQPALLTRSKTIYEPLISSGGVVISAPLLSRTKEIYPPSIQQTGQKVLSPPLLISAKTIYVPAATLGIIGPIRDESLSVPANDQENSATITGAPRDGSVTVTGSGSSALTITGPSRSGSVQVAA